MPFKKLSEQEYTALLKFPAYISLLAANWDDELNENEKKVAIKLSHTKTFSCDPLLTEFYKESDKVFKKNIEQLDNDLPKGKKSRETAIKKELLKLDKIVSKLGKEYASTMHNSMESFKYHVSKAHYNVLMNFNLSLSTKGLTE